MKHSIDTLDLNLLSVLSALYEERSTSKAAQRLGMSQPAVSVALQKLRKAFDDPLFVRTAAGMEPTPRAEAISGPVREVLDRINSDILSGVAFQPQNTTTTFTLALSDIGEMVTLPKVFAHLSKHAPGASLRSVKLTQTQLESALEDGTVDLAIGYFPELDSANHFQQRLYQHSFVSLIRSGHPIGDERLTWEQFRSLGHAMVDPEGRSQELLERFFKAENIELRVVIRTAQFSSLPLIVAQSDLIATVPLAVARLFAGVFDLRLITPPFQLPVFDIRQHWHRRYHKDVRNRWLRESVASVIGDAHDRSQID